MQSKTNNYNVLAEYKSKSRPGQSYYVVQAKDGSHYCTCWQWKKTRTCSHLEHYHYSVAPLVKGSKPCKPDEAELNDAIMVAIKELS